MPCYYPLHGYRSRTVGASGKRALVFSPKDGFTDLPVTVPCGQCRGCRLERSRQWAVRCMQEASLYDRNCFVTLTYSDEFLPTGGTLDKKAFPKFMKRLRKRFPNERPRYYHCGEYGDQCGRPHYHACLFNYDFEDKTLWKMRGGYPVWRSGILEEIWPFGQSELGTVTLESAAYVARYVMKKVTGERAEDHYVRLDEASGELLPLVPEYTTMSRRPGIGAAWFAKFGKEVFPRDEVVVNGRLVKAPGFYLAQLEKLDPAMAEEVRRSRRLARNPDEETFERLRVREECAEARIARLERDLQA